MEPEGETCDTSVKQRWLRHHDGAFLWDGASTYDRRPPANLRIFEDVDDDRALTNTALGVPWTDTSS